MTSHVETTHQDPGFELKKSEYFQNFLLRHLDQARQYKKKGLLDFRDAESKGWKNVTRHQLLSGVMTETVAELIGMPEGQTEWLTDISLTHDIDKRYQQSNLSHDEVYRIERQKAEKPLVATGSNFTDFKNWGIHEFVLRYVDSSIGEETAKTDGQLWGPRDPDNLPGVIIVPWRDRIEAFMLNKVDEGEQGRQLYGVTTWEKLEQIMKFVEVLLYQKIIERSPKLADIYTDETQLTELIEDRIHQKILDFSALPEGARF